MNILLAATLLLASVANINADAADMRVPGLRGVDTADTAAVDGAGASHSRRHLQYSLGDWAFCTSSSQCQNQCCSSKYSTSDGRLKCTPVGGFKPSEGCVGSSTPSCLAKDTNCTLDADWRAPYACGKCCSRSSRDEGNQRICN